MDSASDGTTNGPKHVVVVILENRSYDHLLGYLDPADLLAEPDGVRTTPGTNRGPDGAVETTPTAGFVVPAGPDHSHAGVMDQLGVDDDGGPDWSPTNDGFLRSYHDRVGQPHPFKVVWGKRIGAVGLLLTLLGAAGMAIDGITWGPWVAGLGAVGVVAALGLLRNNPVPPWVPAEVMRCQPPANAAVFHELARHYVVCDRWFGSIPGETWPNRNVAHAGTSGGAVDNEHRFVEHRTIFELLEDAAGTDPQQVIAGAQRLPWRIYHESLPQIIVFWNLWRRRHRLAGFRSLRDFEADVAAGDLPAYTFLEPCHGLLRRLPGVLGELAGYVEPPSSSMHPDNNRVDPRDFHDYDPETATVPGQPGSNFLLGCGLVAHVYEALKANDALFQDTLLVVTFDEHGGFYDHATERRLPSPGDPPARWTKRLVDRLIGHDKVTFDFTLSGPRVPALLISPRLPKGVVDHTVYDHASIPATVQRLFAAAETADALGARVAAANRFTTLWDAGRAAPDPCDLTEPSAFFERRLEDPALPTEPRPVDDHLRHLFLAAQAMGRAVDEDGNVLDSEPPRWRPARDRARLKARYLRPANGGDAAADNLAKARRCLRTDPTTAP